MTAAARLLRTPSFRAWAPALLLAACWNASAQDVPGYPASIDAYDPREVAMLPPYCKYTQIFREKVPGGSDPEQGQRWKAVLGPTFEAMHHYCWGLMKTNRGVLLARNEAVRMAYLNYSIEEFDWVIQRAPEDFVLLPEVLSKKGENLIRLGRGPLGIFSLERAVQLKPDYWPPYAHMSDYYRKTGDTAKAREVLEQGLSFSPDAPALKRRLAELDTGKARAKTSP
ncbi:tetratricopeptide repeat protein [Piscinibacter sp. XHJ-5]|uniref:tetratricopeptide repeat protein n=1 Tax=Piscinibacter sp. XHJ-5 TaxID=3037797 RepID=UPI0024532221|nr:tetratricopeptide repeat protein [Piscinibacter sp. XHJ-5]